MLYLIANVKQLIIALIIYHFEMKHKYCMLWPMHNFKFDQFLFDKTFLHVHNCKYCPRYLFQIINLTFEMKARENQKDKREHWSWCTITLFQTLMYFKKM